MANMNAPGLGSNVQEQHEGEGAEIDLFSLPTIESSILDSEIKFINPSVSFDDTSPVTFALPAFEYDYLGKYK